MFLQNLQHLQLIEAIDSSIELIVCITEGIPVLDMLKVKKNYLILNQD